LSSSLKRVVQNVDIFLSNFILGQFNSIEVTVKILTAVVLLLLHNIILIMLQQIRVVPCR